MIILFYEEIKSISQSRFAVDSSKRLFLGHDGDLLLGLRIEYQGLGFFPREAVVAEMSIFSRRLVNGAFQAQFPDDDARSQVEIGVDNVQKFGLAKERRAKREY